LDARFGPAYLLQAVLYRARRLRRYAWARLVTAMDPVELRGAEHATYRPHQPSVRVPL
jgi:hypothetical protein